MKNNDEATDKRYYKIRDVSEMTGVNQPTLRFWESEFPALKPRRNDGGTRFYTPADIELIRQIRYLLKDKGLKISAARDELSRRGDEIKRRTDAIERLKQIRATLVSLGEALTARRREAPR